MNEQSKQLTPEQRKNMAIEAIKKDLATLPSHGLFGSNASVRKELENWVDMLEGKLKWDDEIKWFMSTEGKWIYSNLCDYLP